MVNRFFTQTFIFPSLMCAGPFPSGPPGPGPFKPQSVTGATEGNLCLNTLTFQERTQ